MGRSFSAWPLREAQLLRVVLAGELDIATVPEFEAALPRPAAGEMLAIDLRDLSFIDSAGVHALMRLDVASRRDGWSLALVRGPDSVQRVLELCRIDDRIRIVGDTEQLRR
jgi:anti-anti-sigma factor